jgi:excisionase family DNA binding protein
MTNTEQRVREAAIWSLEETATNCKVSFMTIYRAVAAGELHSHDLGRREVRFIPAEVIKWATERAARKAERKARHDRPAGAR